MASNTTELSLKLFMNNSSCLVLQAQEFIPWNNSDTIVSVHVENMLRNMKVLVFLPITFVIGVPANIINMVVFYKHGLKERINVCLFALSLADAIYLSINMLDEGEQLYLHFTTKERYGPVTHWLTNNSFVAFYGCSWVSQVLSAIIASERCFCILQPLKSQAVLLTSTMTVIVVAVFIVILGIRFFVVTRYNVTCVYDPITSETTMTSTGSEFYHKHKKVLDFLDIFLYGIGLPWLVIVVVIATTIVTVIKLRQTAKWRAGTSSSTANISARDIALTRMLVGNSTFFIVCVLPVCLYRVSPLFMPEIAIRGRHHNLATTGMWLSTTFSLINSTFNILVYYTMGSRYRQTFWALLGRNNAGNKENPNK